jgi:hypothetical protein
MMYRIAPPMKLPMPTMNMDFSIWGGGIFMKIFLLFLQWNAHYEWML